jgi:hypothetical protein
MNTLDFSGPMAILSDNDIVSVLHQRRFRSLKYLSFIFLPNQKKLGYRTSAVSQNSAIYRYECRY